MLFNFSIFWIVCREDNWTDELKMFVEDDKLPKELDGRTKLKAVFGNLDRQSQYFLNSRK